MIDWLMMRYIGPDIVMRMEKMIGPDETLESTYPRSRQQATLGQNGCSDVMIKVQWGKMKDAFW